MSGSILHFPTKQIMVSQLFTSSGSFDVPKGIDKLWIEGTGAGGGGGALGGGDNSSGGNAGGIGSKIVSVTPEDNITITIGVGGGGGTIADDGSDGGNSTFGALMTFRGGRGGFGVSSGSARPNLAGPASGAKGGGTGPSGVGTVFAFAEDSTEFAGGGQNGGGGGWLGTGGNGNNGGDGNGAGAGGGGRTSIGGDGGDGSNGAIRVTYFINR